MTADPASIDEISEILRTIAHPTRIRILQQLTRADACVTELSGALQLPTPTCVPSASAPAPRPPHAPLPRPGSNAYALTGVPAVSLVLDVLKHCT